MQTKKSVGLKNCIIEINLQKRYCVNLVSQFFHLIWFGSKCKNFWSGIRRLFCPISLPVSGLISTPLNLCLYISSRQTLDHNTVWLLLTTLDEITRDIYHHFYKTFTFQTFAFQILISSGMVMIATAWLGPDVNTFATAYSEMWLWQKW